MRNAISTIAITGSLWLAAMPVQVHALESTANSGDVQQTDLSLNMKIDSGIAALTSVLNSMLYCNRNDRVYAPTAADADAKGCRKLTPPTPFDPLKLEMNSGAPDTKRLGARAMSTATNAAQICQEEGYSGVTNYSGKQYSSPGNNKVANWNGSSWVVIGANNGAHFSSLTCYVFSQRP